MPDAQPPEGAGIPQLPSAQPKEELEELPIDALNDESNFLLSSELQLGQLTSSILFIDL